MPQVIPSRVVTVYLFRGSAKTRKGLRIRCRKLGDVTVTTSGTMFYRERMAAEAWIMCEGLHRRQRLIELNAPEAIIKYQTDVEAIAAEITRAPAGFVEDESYIYDNHVETWLMVIPYDDFPASRFSLEMDHIPVADGVGQLATNRALRSLWFPNYN